MRPTRWRNFFPSLYDLAMVVAEHGRLATWRESTVAPARGRVLEIGAGTGLDFPYYAPGVTVIATDPDVGMLGRARERTITADASILLVAADAESLPFREGTFDTGIVGLALCTIPRPLRALAELRRVVRGGGEVRLLEHVRAPNRLGSRLQDWLTPVWRRVAGGCHLNRDAVSAVRESGLQLERVISHAAGCVVEILARTPAPARR
jgi:ubiquinone/menaquinone biosynthesis C-methylase UbiE